FRIGHDEAVTDVGRLVFVHGAAGGAGQGAGLVHTGRTDHHRGGGHVAAVGRRHIAVPVVVRGVDGRGRVAGTRRGGLVHVAAVRAADEVAAGVAQAIVRDHLYLVLRIAVAGEVHGEASQRCVDL